MIYEYHDFPKADKAILREILSIGVKREIEHFIKESFPYHKVLTEERFEDIREPFWKLSNKFKDFSKYILRKYDGYKHSDIPMKLAELLYDKHFTQKDIEHFSEAGKEKINEMVDSLDRMRN